MQNDLEDFQDLNLSGHHLLPYHLLEIWCSHKEGMLDQATQNG